VTEGCDLMDIFQNVSERTLNGKCKSCVSLKEQRIHFAEMF
jgi:hypothetical protein